jgi:hypothetical protein
MPMDASEIERRIKAALPDADIDIRDLAGDGDHYAATVISEQFPRQVARAAAPDRLCGPPGRHGRRFACPGPSDQRPGIAVSLRDSLDLIRTVRPEAGTAALESTRSPRSARSSLSGAERKVISTIAALSAGEGERATILAEAREAVWAYFVQRELIGFRRHSDVIQELNIPREVLAGLGAMTKHKA